MKPPSSELQSLKATFFAALAHPVRIRLLEVLAASGEHSVQELQSTLGIEQPIVSQQLARLRASGVVTARKAGTSMRYALADPMLADLLRVAKQILNRQLVGVRSMLLELNSDDTARRHPRPAAGTRRR